MNYVERQTAAVTRSWSILAAIAFGLAIGAGSGASALANTAPNPPPGPAATAQAGSPQIKPNSKTDPDDEVVCKKEHATGTRLDYANVCHTKAEWRQMAHDSADYLNHRYVSPR